MKKKISTIYTITFLSIIILFSVISVANWLIGKINHTVYNNEIEESDTEDLAEIYFGQVFFERDNFINLNGLMRDILGQREMNGVIKLDNGYLLKPMEKAEDEKLTAWADNLAILNEYCKESGREFLYVGTPYTSSKFDPQIPFGVEDYGNENTDNFLQLLEDRNIDVLDIRQEMYDDGIDQYDMMYKTDHHWTERGGFYAYNKIADYIADSTGVEASETVRDENNYDYKTYKRWHLGSNGQRTGIYYGGIDDFEMMTPTFYTSIMTEEGVEGRYEDIVINYTPLKSRNYNYRMTYDDVYKFTLGTFTNLYSSNDLKVLLISDSFGKTVAPFLTMSYGQIKYIDGVSDLGEFSMTDIEDFDPDIIIMLYYVNRFDVNNGDHAFNLNNFK